MYMTVMLYFDLEVNISNLIKPLFFDSTFKPIGIVGSDNPHWLLSGYDVKSGIDRYFSPRGKEFNVQIEPEANDNDQLNYIQALFNKLSNSDQDDSIQVSPYEFLGEGNNLTHIESRISLTTFEKAMDWINQHPLANIIIHGSVLLALKNEEDSSDYWAYRYSYDNYIDWPMLEIRVMQRRKGIEHIAVSFDTSSEVWLRDNSIQKLSIGNQEADINLNRLATLIYALFEPNRKHYKKGYVDFEGIPFMSNALRVRAALSEIPSLD